MRYSENFRSIWRSRVQRLSNSQPQFQSVTPVYLNGDFKSYPIEKLQKLLILDIVKKNTRFQFYFPDNKLQGVPRNEVEQRQSNQIGSDTKQKMQNAPKRLDMHEEISALFLNAVDPCYKTYAPIVSPGSRTTTPDFTQFDEGNGDELFVNLVKLQSEDGLNHVDTLWPPAHYSLGCRGVGLSVDEFERLSKIGVKALVHPLTQKGLGLFKVDFVPHGYKAIGLLPSKIKKHGELFVGPYRFEALMPFRCCNSQEIKTMTKNIISTTLSPSEARGQAVMGFQDEVGKISNGGLALNSTIRSTAKLLLALKSGKLLDNKYQYAGKLISTDVLRATVLANNINDIQLQEEYFKLNIIYNIIREIEKLLARVPESEYSSDLKDVCTPWDEFIWQRLSDVNGLPDPISVCDTVQNKLKFDQFLHDLNVYHALVVAELKRNSKSNSKSVIKRQQMITFMLYNLLTKCTWMRYLYPTLYFHVVETISPKIIPEGLIGNTRIELGSGIHVIAKTVLNLENIAYSDVLKHKGKDEQQTHELLRDYKIAILIMDKLGAETKRLLQFTTKVNTQVVQDLSNVDRVAFSEVVEKRMIDNKTYVYLYKTKRLPENKEVIIKNILDRLEHAAD